MKSTYTRQYQEFLVRIKAARKDAGMTQEALARRLKRPQSFVSKYESGERRLDVIEFMHIAEAIGVNASDFVESISPWTVKKKAKG
ncbi:MAG: helix-turn-helix transcriptional regulator [Burkholderiales bacterium]|nr:helix-turn-helix transcriptional regulator [Burkholderiales bacterium]